MVGEDDDAAGSEVVEVLTLGVGEEGDFDLVKAVCSHGLFMMAPNRWDTASETLSRPLRLDPHTSVRVSISHPHPRPSPLRIAVHSKPLSPDHRHAILAQVRRMLRFSDKDNETLQEFHSVHPIAAEKGLGRIFRSPTLFEDMVKCILLCNCQWSRTLSMAKALCELQFELNNGKILPDFEPRTPQKKDNRRSLPKKRRRLINHHNEATSNEKDASLADVDSVNKQNNLFTRSEHSKVESSGHHLIDATCKIGNFPCPEELAYLTEQLLANRCGLGYRAKRILSLAKSVVEKKIQLEELEEHCNRSHESYDIIAQRLSALDGFGPFTCANVLMCMGYYHKIPSDSETIRHLKYIHSRNCTMRSIGKDLEEIYGRYAPFQFLAYWIELWEFYETRFGKSSQMSCDDYQRITAANMKMVKNRDEGIVGDRMVCLT